MSVLTFFAGLLLGGILGVFAMCLCVAAGNADRRMEGTDDRNK